MRPEIRFHPAALLAAVRGRWRALFHRDALDRELDEEMRFHLRDDVIHNRGARRFHVLARLRDGISVQALNARLPAAGDAAGVGAFTDELIADLEAIPGVERASAAGFIPVRGTRRTVGAETRDASGETKRRILDANAVGPGYFGVMGLAVLRGRDFEPRDVRASNPVVIVSRAMADALWPSEDPLGKWLTIDARRRSTSMEVIGVVADPVGQGPATAASLPGLLYLPIRSVAEAELALHVRVPEAQPAIAEQIVRRLRAESLRLISSEIMTLDRHYGRADLPQRLMAQASGVLPALQLLLAAAGLSGLVAFVTQRRRREVGIRSALGASRGSVLALVMRQGIKLTVIGGAIGIAMSLVVSRVVAASLPVTTAMVTGALVLAAVVSATTCAMAMLLPALRALDATPAEALRLD